LENKFIFSTKGSPKLVLASNLEIIDRPIYFETPEGAQMVIYTYFDTYDSPLIYAELLLKNVDLRYPEQPISKFE